MQLGLCSPTISSSSSTKQTPCSMHTYPQQAKQPSCTHSSHRIPATLTPCLARHPGNLANEELPVWGVDSDALQAIIEFFYSGQCNLTFPSAVAVMDAANRLDVPSLSSAANSFVREALSVNTASTILGHALQFKLSELAGSCLTVIRDK